MLLYRVRKIDEDSKKEDQSLMTVLTGWNGRDSKLTDYAVRE